MVVTKAKTLYYLADKIIRPYTMYVIVRENFEHKDFKQGLWEMWETVGKILEVELDDEKKLMAIDEISSEIGKTYWRYIDGVLCEIKSKKTNQDIDISVYENRINDMKVCGVIDERALVELRLIEENLY